MELQRPLGFLFLVFSFFAPSPLDLNPFSPSSTANPTTASLYNEYA